jgi:RNA polymerase sigma-70 factor (ECF subfamily)
MAIAAAQRGEALSHEVEELFREHYELLYRTAYGITGNRHDAEDVLQSVFVKLLQTPLPDLKHPARYAYRAAVNLSLNVVRARKSRKLVNGVEQLQIPAAAVDERNGAHDSDEWHELLMDAITRLNKRAIEILMLHYKHGYTDAQIAKLLGTSRGTIAVTLFRIRARLKRFLESARSNGELV